MSGNRSDQDRENAFSGLIIILIIIGAIVLVGAGYLFYMPHKSASNTTNPNNVGAFTTAPVETGGVGRGTTATHTANPAIETPNTGNHQPVPAEIVTTHPDEKRSTPDAPDSASVQKGTEIHPSMHPESNQ